MITQMITDALGVASLDIGTIGGGILLVFAGIFAGRATAQPVLKPNYTNKGRRTYAIDGKMVSRQEFHRHRGESHAYDLGYQAYLKQNVKTSKSSSDKRAYWKDPVIFDRKSGTYISREEAREMKRVGQRIKQSKPKSSMPLQPKNGMKAYNQHNSKPSGFSRPVRNITSRSSAIKKTHSLSSNSGFSRETPDQYKARIAKAQCEGKIYNPNIKLDFRKVNSHIRTQIKKRDSY